MGGIMSLFMLSLFGKANAYTGDDFHRNWFWMDEPKVIEICDDVSTKKEMVEEALQFWIDNKVIEEKIAIKPIGNCNDDYHMDAIMITTHKNFNIDKYYAMTYLDEWYGQGILGARIEIDPIEKDNLILMIHELGHALGIGHEEQDIYHIMYPKVLSTPTKISTLSSTIIEKDI